LHLDDGRLWRGGQYQAWLLMRELAAQGVVQRLAARPGSPLAERAAAIGVAVDPFDAWSEWNPLAARRLAAMARDFGVNLLHAHAAHAHAAGLAAARMLKGKARLVVTRRVDFAVGRGPFSGRKYRDPRQHFIAISEGVRRVLIDGGVASDRIDVVASGVPPIDPDRAWPRAVARREFAIGEGELAIVNVGALTDHKGQRWLVEAAPRVLEAYPAARVHVLGEGELRGALERRIAELGLAGRVVLHGHVADAREKLAGFDLYVSSSHLEGLGTSILDAMLAGLPVVAAAAGGVADAVVDGQTGRLVAPRDPAALAEAIRAALADPEGSRRLAERAAARVAERFSERAMAAGTLAVYRKLLSVPIF
jgi:glycosyltransferase involved in cell wall biosynthesis